MCGVSDMQPVTSEREELTVPYSMTFGLQFHTASRREAQRNKRIITHSELITLHTRFQNVAPYERGQCKSEANYPLRPPIIWSCAHRAPPEQECVDKRPQNGPWRIARSDLFPSSSLTFEENKHAVGFKQVTYLAFVYK